MTANRAGFMSLTDSEVLEVRLVEENGQTRMGIILKHRHQVVAITLDEHQASRLMSGLEKHFCSDPNCQRHNGESP